MIKPLIWKEWHEQRWKLFFGTAMLAFFTGSLLAARLSTNREIVVVVWILGGLVLSLYSAMGVFAPEITNGTKTFLSSKPIQSWKIFLGKLFFGWLNFAVPMLICSAALATVTLLHPADSVFELKYIAKGTFLAVCMGTAFYSMTCCFAPRKSSEAMVGFTGLMVFFAFILHIMITDLLIVLPATRDSMGFSFFQELTLYISPAFLLSLMGPIDFKMHPSFFIAEQAIIFIITILIGLRKWQRSI